jgi:hypothetical protein
LFALQQELATFFILLLELAIALKPFLTDCFKWPHSFILALIEINLDFKNEQYYKFERPKAS